MTSAHDGAKASLSRDDTNSLAVTQLTCGWCCRIDANAHAATAIPWLSTFKGLLESLCTRASPSIWYGSAPSPWHAPALPKAHMSADSSTRLNFANLRGSRYPRTAESNGGENLPAMTARCGCFSFTSIHHLGCSDLANAHDSIASPWGVKALRDGIARVAMPSKRRGAEDLAVANAQATLLSS
eukprot:scaffold152805_cov35-Tisochrysis_lutea.AAC.2